MKCFKNIYGIFITIALVLYIGSNSIGNIQENTQQVEVEQNSDIKPTSDTIQVRQRYPDEKFVEAEFATYPYKVSKEGKEFIKKHENLKLIAYDDPSPEKRSIGWGHQIQPGEKYDTITAKQANEIFEQDIKKIEASVNRLLKKTNKNFKYTQGFIDGMASLVYNCGEYGVSTTDFYQRLLNCRIDHEEESNINELDLNYTLAAVKTSKVFCEGHKIRRANEYRMMID